MHVPLVGLEDNFKEVERYFKKSISRWNDFLHCVFKEKKWCLCKHMGSCSMSYEWIHDIYGIEVRNAIGEIYLILQ